MDSLALFLEKYLPDLPWTVLCEVLQYLPSELIYDPLFKVPDLRNIILETYYSKELHFILSPTLRPHFCTLDQQNRELIDITSYGEIEDFLLENTDVCPLIVRVITNQDFRSMELLLTTFRDFFLAVPNLQIQVEKYELSVDDMKLLLSFPNLNKLQTGGIKLHRALPAMISGFPHIENLKEIVFLGHELVDWSHLTLPPNLKNFDVSWHPSTDVASMTLPESVVNLYWNQVKLTDNIFDSLALSLRLRTLMLTYNVLERINVSQLPINLETIDLSHNNLDSFDFDAKRPRWPPRLRSILLSNNLIDNKALRDLSKIEWPPFLENLRLDMNDFTRLDDLRALPANLKYLDISNNLINGFDVAHEENEYPYFKFPEALESLNLQSSRSLRFPEAPGSLEYRIKFPGNLETLNLDECNIDNLSVFLFPSSLKTLSLSGNKITSLSSYEYTMDGSRIISWSQLDKLHELVLFYNRIMNLQSWMPPTSIRKIDLRRNFITLLSKINTPLFNQLFCDQLVELHVLNMEQNKIIRIDADIDLPPNLTDLNLSSNHLTQFELIPAFCTTSLEHLDISSNDIQEISVSSGISSPTSNLKSLNLYNNSGPLSVTPEQFYTMLEKVGLYVAKRKHNIKSEHLFKAKEGDIN